MRKTAVRGTPCVLYGNQVFNKYPPETEPSMVASWAEQGPLRHSTFQDGINCPYFYIEGCNTRFSFHVEDASLSSVAYLHHLTDGAIKVWLYIPASEKVKLEELVENKDKAISENWISAASFLRGRMTMISPKELKDAKITVRTGRNLRRISRSRFSADDASFGIQNVALGKNMCKNAKKLCMA